YQAKAGWSKIPVQPGPYYGVSFFYGRVLHPKPMSQLLGAASRKETFAGSASQLGRTLPGNYYPPQKFHSTLMALRSSPRTLSHDSWIFRPMLYQPSYITLLK